MNPKSILVIDDSLDLLEIYAVILTDYGYEVTTRSTGRDALEFVSSRRPDLVILDINLDGYDGRDICNTLKQTPGLKDIPVVIVSANTPLERQILGYCNPDSFMEKPFDIDELVSTIESHLQKAS